MRPKVKVVIDMSVSNKKLMEKSNRHNMSFHVRRELKKVREFERKGIEICLLTKVE